MKPETKNLLTIGGLFAATIIFYALNINGIYASDTVINSIVPNALLHGQGADISNYKIDVGYGPGNNTPVINPYPVVLPLVVLPAYLPLELILSGSNDYYGDAVRYAPVMNYLCSIILAAFTGILFYIVARGLFGEKIGVVGFFAYSFGTAAWCINSVQLWAHSTSCLFCLLMTYCVLRHIRAGTSKWLFALALIIPIYFFNRPYSFIILLPFVVYLAYHIIKSEKKYLSTGLASGLPLLEYNLYYFGNVWGGKGVPVEPVTTMMRDAPGNGLWYAITADANNIMLNLIGPSKGLLTESPFLLFAVPGALSMIRRGWFWSLAAIAVVIYVIAYGVIVPSYTQGLSFYGQRYFVDVLPFLVLFALASLKESGLLTKILFAVLLGYSFAYQMIGIYIYPFTLDGWARAADNDHSMYYSLWNSEPVYAIRNLLNAFKG